jgi:cytochrome c peroxidase
LNKKVALIAVAVLLLASFVSIEAFSLLSKQAVSPAPSNIQPQPSSSGGSLILIEQLGKALFFDENLSKYRNQSCATCHDPSVGYTGGGDAHDSATNARAGVYAGSDSALYGGSKPPSAAYAGDSPVLHYDAVKKVWVGGMFNDGRATGSELGDPLAEQAKGPFLNPLEMALGSAEELRQRVKESNYTGLFDSVWSEGALNGDAQTVYNQIGKSLAAFERSVEVNPHNSKFDLFWDNAHAKGLNVTDINLLDWQVYLNLGLDANELYGLAVFNDPRGANCVSCHSMQPGSGGYPLFTNYEYDNIGVPRNPQNPFYANAAHNPQGASWVDKGLGDTLEKVQPASAPQEVGKMKTATLRNVDKRPSADFVRAYGHNGFFKSLPEIIDFYWSRSATMGMGMGMRGMGMGYMMFPPPEINQNLNQLFMFPRSAEPYLYAFLTTLSDGYFQRQS